MDWRDYADSVWTVLIWLLAACGNGNKFSISTNSEVFLD